MNFAYYQALVDDAKKIDDKNYWIHSYGYPADCPYTPRQLLEILEIIYDVAHDDLTSIIKRIGTGAAFGRLYGIPYRTVQNWRNNVTQINDYTLRLIAYPLIVQIECENNYGQK